MGNEVLSRKETKAIFLAIKKLKRLDKLNKKAHKFTTNDRGPINRSSDKKGKAILKELIRLKKAHHELTKPIIETHGSDFYKKLTESQQTALLVKGMNLKDVMGTTDKNIKILEQLFLTVNIPQQQRFNLMSKPLNTKRSPEPTSEGKVATITPKAKRKKLLSIF
jgi:hypothetical protein